MSEIDWIEVEPGTAWLGDSRGALLHVGNGPRHEIQVGKQFEISSKPITFAQWKQLTGQAVAGEDSQEPVNRLTPLMIEAGLIGVEGNPRPPSEAEWALNTVIVEGDNKNSRAYEKAEGDLAQYTGSVEMIRKARKYLERRRL